MENIINSRSLQGGWEMIPKAADINREAGTLKVKSEDMYKKTFSLLAERVTQEVDTPNLFNTTGSVSEVQRIVKKSFDKTAFITSSPEGPYTFRDDVMSTRDVHTATGALKKLIALKPIISGDRLRSVYETRFMLETMDHAQVRRLIIHGMSEEHQDALDTILTMAEKILDNLNNKISLEDLGKYLGSSLLMPLDFYSNIETSLVYRENDVKKGRPYSKEENRVGLLELDQRVKINTFILKMLLGR